MILSVIIPVYRVEATLDRCVESVLKQSIDNMEVILVNDGSPDHCPEMCDKWAQKDCPIKVIHKENGGLSDARNV
jgi:glycosyltransferase involved in cell wall biosynthesis